MACGDKYRYLIRNDRGKTWEDPCDMFCSEFDYASWHRAAEGLVPRVVAQWGNLARLEWRQDKDKPIANSLRDQIAAYEAATRELRSPAGVLLLESAVAIGGFVDQAVAVMGDGACALENLDAAFEQLDERIPEVPGVGRYPEDRGRGGTLLDALGDVAATVAVVGILGGAGYLAWKYSARPQPVTGAEA